MQIMRGYERAWQVFRFTVIPRSFRWLRIFILPSVREQQLRRLESRRRLEEDIVRARERLESLQGITELKRLQREVGLIPDGRIGPRTLDVVKRIEESHWRARHAMKNTQIN